MLQQTISQGGIHAGARACACHTSPLGAASCLNALTDILAERRLQAVFQPIANISQGTTLGYEALIRGPADSPLHAPLDLLGAAAAHDLLLEVEALCLSTIVARYAELGLAGKLFLNISPVALLQFIALDRFENELAWAGLQPAQIVFEITESHYPHADYSPLSDVLARLRTKGFQFALDDFGEGYSSVRRWFELRPEYVKLDMYFVRGVSADPLRQKLILTLCDLTRSSGATLIAEGIEDAGTFELLHDAGVACGQGYYLGRPQARPEPIPEAILGRRRAGTSVAAMLRDSGRVNARTLLRPALAVPPEMTNNELYDVFVAQPGVTTVPVVNAAGQPLGMVTRHALIDRFARPYQRELYGRRNCTMFMDEHPLIADHATSLQQLSQSIVDADPSRLIADFIITEEGRYIGIGTSHDLLREITSLQMDAARHANPLTQLPGNVPINQYLARLLNQHVPFCACYVDLDAFKPFNDVFGYARGDEILQLTGRLLSENVDAAQDFVGHIGGDDFLMVFESADWRERCEMVLQAYEAGLAAYCRSDAVLDAAFRAGGYYATDRLGKQCFYALPSLSIGAVQVEPDAFQSYHEIAAAASEAKLQAKKISGNSFFVERRKHVSLSLA